MPAYLPSWRYITFQIKLLIHQLKKQNLTRVFCCVYDVFVDPKQKQTSV